MSVEAVTNPVWGIFEPEHMDMSTVEKEMTEYREMNVTNTDTLTKYEIETRDRDSFILPHEGQLEVRFNITQTDNANTAIPATDVIALQNNALSLFKNIEYQIEDQRIEYCDDPGLGFTVKNLSEFSKQYGESVASNQLFYLDTKDEPTTSSCNVRFFNNTAPRVGVELFFVQNANNELTPNIPVNANNAPSTGFFDGDSVVAYVNVTNIVAGGANGAVVGTPVLFYTFAPNGDVTPVTRQLTIDTAANHSRLLTSGGANGDLLGAYIQGSGEEVKFLRQNLVIKPTITVAGNIVTVAGGANNNVFFAKVNAPDSYNTGYAKRVALAAGSTLVSVWIPLKNMFLFCRSYDKVSRGLRHKLVLNRQDDSQMLYRLGGVDRKVVISYISCWIPRLKPNLETLKILEGKLASNDLYTVNFTDLTVWRTTAALTGNASGSAIQLATTTKKPIKVWVVFQRAERINSSQTWNRRVFDHLNTTNIQCRLNGRQYPLYEYKIGDNFTFYNRLYHAFLSAGHKNIDSMDGSLIDFNTFKSLYPIFYFDLTAQEEDLWTAVKYAELEIRWSNQVAGLGLPNGYHVWVIYESERVIKFKGVAGSLAIQQ